MLVVVVMGDVQADLVDPCAPAQQVAVQFAVQLQASPTSASTLRALASTRESLLRIDVVALHQRADGAFAHVLVLVTADQVVENAFAQGALGVNHLFQFQRVEVASRMASPAGKMVRRSGDPLQIELLPRRRA